MYDDGAVGPRGHAETHAEFHLNKKNCQQGISVIFLWLYAAQMNVVPPAVEEYSRLFSHYTGCNGPPK